MSRMFLYLDNPQQPTGNITATYPIYELDLQGLADASMVSWGLGGQITNAVNECYHLSGSVNNANVNRYLSTNIPHQQWQDGSILQARISKYVLDENDIYVPDPDYYSFETVPIGQRPDDWGTAANYLRYVVSSNATINGQPATYRAYYNVRKTATWNPEAQYVRDTNRSMIRLFYTKNGYSFGVYQGADCEGADSSCGPVFNVAGYSQYSDDLSSPSPSKYVWCNPSGNRLQVGGNSVRVQLLWYTRTDSAAEKGDMLQGYEPAAGSYFVFVHATYDNKDYYGTVGIYPQSFAEETPFNQINFSLFTEDFWGDSIIAGGGGESVWGNDGPTSIPQGGNGSWNAPSDNRGDPDGTTATQTGSIWGGNHSIFDIGYKKYILGSPDAAAFGQMVGRLSNPEDWGSGFTNKYYNPIQAIISCHMIPANLAPAHTGSDKIVAATVNLTDTTVPTFSTLYYSKHIGSVNLAEYTGSFADYTNTSIYINLPYIGVKQLDTAACMNGQVAVDYLIDYLTGDTTAWVWVKDRFGNNNIRYEWKGNIARPIPLTQRVPASTQFMSSLIPAVATAAGSVAVGGLVGAVGGAGSMLSWGLGEYGSIGEFLKGGASGAISGFGEGISKAARLLTKGGIGSMGIGAAVGSALNAGQQMTSSNANGGSVSSPVNTQCYLSISRPQWSAPEDYRMHFGYPSDVSGTINDKFEGFLSVRDIKLENIYATAEEKAEITNLMSAGVYVSDNFGPTE